MLLFKLIANGHFMVIGRIAQHPVDQEPKRRGDQ